MAMRSSTTDAGAKQKVLVVGPCEAGKTLVANVLAEAVETASEIYRPTVGVRIMEFETEIRSSQRVTVELWDASGDPKFSKCWPAIKKDAAGVVLVYNPEKPNSDQELEQWFGWFPRQMGFAPSQVLVVQSLRRTDAKRAPLPAKLAQAGVSPAAAVTPDDMAGVRKNFCAFVETVRQTVLDRQRQEEEDVMKGG
ncbi:unnamed protein product [Prorocentrum cordatum]|uniref:Intraflagellar transport protein 22 homolog n=1 Tax=Prorocentrum cordatum TaxID=2364126 RepID=A0ABN9TBH7_9DINO|nr:unnamed protein product [Polarella glacialis]